MSSLAYVLNQICEDYNALTKQYRNNLRVETLTDDWFLGEGKYYEITFKQLSMCVLNDINLIGICEHEGIHEQGESLIGGYYETSSDYDLTLGFKLCNNLVTLTYCLSYQRDIVYNFYLYKGFSFDCLGANYRSDGFTDEGNCYTGLSLSFRNGVFTLTYKDFKKVYNLFEEEQEALI